MRSEKSLRSPLANCICERVIRTFRRECLDLLIPLTELRLLRVVREWARYYNTARPHRSLDPGIPSPPETLPVSRTSPLHLGLGASAGQPFKALPGVGFGEILVRRLRRQHAALAQGFDVALECGLRAHGVAQLGLQHGKVAAIAGGLRRRRHWHNQCPSDGDERTDDR